MYLSVFGVAMGWANPREFICMWIAFWEGVTVGKKESGPSKLRYGAVGGCEQELWHRVSVL